MATGFSTSPEHQLLLDTIDRLRLYGVGKYVDIPEIIVCGEQSSGKSATMEALSRFAFPTKDNLCTRFATEVVLRRSVDGDIKISIIPSPDSSQEHRKALTDFHVTTQSVEQDFDSIVEKAKIAMGISDKKVFSTDILRVEISGPSQPHLTLVDLPGIFRAGNRDQSIEDAHTVRELVRGYMKRPRSIILTVVSAKNDFNLQEVTELARELDPNGSRTIGLITKPDTLDLGSDSELAYVKLARNHDVEFRLGWHVVKNRSYETRNTSLEERDAVETAFFSTGTWATVDPKILGIDSLRYRLSIVLREQIALELPGLLNDLRLGIKDCTRRLKRLGDSRSNTSDQRRYLIRISQQFTSIINASGSGFYNDEYFGDPLTDQGYERRLRAVVQNLLVEFEEQMRTIGHEVDILEDHHGVSELGARQISRAAYLAKVRTVMRRSRGCELPGTFNPLIITHLFKEQCRPWKSLVLELHRDVLAAVYKAAHSAIEFIAADDTIDGIKQIINKSLSALMNNLGNKINELLYSCYELHPITYNHYLTEQVQSMQDSRRRRVLENHIKSYFGASNLGVVTNASQQVNLALLFDKIESGHDSDMDKNGASLAADYMQAYYKVALKRFVDDVSIFAVESCLLNRISGLFTPETIHEISDQQINVLASESNGITLQRQQLSQQLEILKHSLHELDQLSRTQVSENTEQAIMDKSPHINSTKYIEESDSVTPPDELPEDSRFPPPSSPSRHEEDPTPTPFVFSWTAETPLKRKKKGKAGW